MCKFVTPVVFTNFKNVFPSVSRLLWSSTSHPGRLQWTSRGTWRPMWRRRPKRPMAPLWGRGCWSSWMTWTCQRYLQYSKLPTKSLMSFTVVTVLVLYVWHFLIYCVLVQVDSYGTQQPIVLLKLLLDRGGIYDRGKELNCKILKDLGFIAAMGKAGGGRNEVDPRFVSLFSVFSIPFPAVDSLHLIYASSKATPKWVAWINTENKNLNHPHSSYLINLIKHFLVIWGRITEGLW